MYNDAEGGAPPSDQYGFMSYAPQSVPQGGLQQPASTWGTSTDQLGGGDDDEFANEPPLMQG